MLPRTPLQTTRLLLRPYEAADVSIFFAVLDHSRKRLHESFPDRLRAVPTLAAAEVQLREFTTDWATGRFYVLGIWQRDTHVYLGDICLMPQPHGRAEIGYYLSAEAEGQGYAREALAAVCQFGFKTARAQKLLIRCHLSNVRAQTVARAAGFQPEGFQAPEPAAWFRFGQNAPAPQPILIFSRLPG